MPNATQTAADLSPKVAANTHALYKDLKETWTQLAHVREGTGGFLTGEYLRAHPREWLDHTLVSQTTDAATGAVSTIHRANPNPRQPSAKLLMRRRLARYENVASAIVQATKAMLFRDQPTRRVGAHGPTETAAPIERWWQDVDGRETHIDDAMAIWWDLAATFGHVGLYFCQEAIAEASTAADEAVPYVRVYTPLDILNWLTDDDGQIVSVKLQEAIPPDSYETQGPEHRVRVVDTTSVTVYDLKSGKQQSRWDHGLGRLPFVFLFAKRRPLLADVGESILGDPRAYIDLFNLTSEVRELLRNQTFSFINLPLGKGQDAQSVEEAQTMLGKQTGTMNVLFSAEAGQILTGDPANVTSYHQEIERLRREIYRETGVQWESDTTQAEAMGSLKIKREDMTARLSMYADECQKAEYALVDLFYRASFGADQAERKLGGDQVTVQYPNRFDHEPFTNILAEVESASAIGMPVEVLKTLRKQILPKFEGMADLPPEQLQELEQAIDAAPDEQSGLEALRARLQGLSSAVPTDANANPAAQGAAA
ncbi:MAG: hypothetical protein AB7Q29_19275 [Vicinamibacterales bacterium]